MLQVVRENRQMVAFSEATVGLAVATAVVEAILPQTLGVPHVAPAAEAVAEVVIDFRDPLYLKMTQMLLIY